jgi:hypothetical protein
MKLPTAAVKRVFDASNSGSKTKPSGRHEAKHKARKLAAEETDQAQACSRGKSRNNPAESNKNLKRRPHAPGAELAQNSEIEELIGKHKRAEQRAATEEPPGGVLCAGPGKTEQRVDC